jgi:hypothetical protein
LREPPEPEAAREWTAAQSEYQSARRLNHREKNQRKNHKPAQDCRVRHNGHQQRRYGPHCIPLPFYRQRFEHTHLPAGFCAGLDPHLKRATFLQRMVSARDLEGFVPLLIT